MDVSNFGCDERFYLLFTLLNSIETWNLRKKKLYNVSLGFIRNIFTINIFILY